MREVRDNPESEVKVEMTGEPSVKNGEERYRNEVVAVPSMFLI